MENLEQVYKCSVCGREEPKEKLCPSRGLLFCSKHMHQIRRLGYTTDCNPRNQKDPNEFILYDTYAEIVIYNSQSEEIGGGIIDLDDVERCKQFKWRYGPKNYIISSQNLFLHRFLLSHLLTEELYVDHIDRDKSNNRKCNLRVCDQSQNQRNKSKESNQSSDILGVRWCKDRGKWGASIRINNIQTGLGYFLDVRDALIARVKAERLYYGEFASNHNLTLLEKYNVTEEDLNVNQ
jgi:hypothetical protein